jgi:hypothetical protein
MNSAPKGTKIYSLTWGEGGAFNNKKRGKAMHKNFRFSWIDVLSCDPSQRQQSCEKTIVAAFLSPQSSFANHCKLEIVKKHQHTTTDTEILPVPSTTLQQMFCGQN